METKNEQQKQNLIWIFIVLVLVIICSLLFIQNKKIERIMVMTNTNYDPYGFNFGMKRRPNNDVHLFEKRINEKFLEFAGEIEELKYIVNSIVNESYEDYMEKIDNEVSEKNEVIKSSSKEKIKDDKASKKTKKQKKDKKKSKSKNNYKNDQFEVETDYDEDDKEYEVEIKLPNYFTMDDINVTLRNSVLKIKIEKEIKDSDKNSSYYKYGSFYQSFTIPKTKATTKDVKKKIENGKLEIKVPIK